MKTVFASLRESGRAVILGCIILSSATGMAFTQSQSQNPVPVLEGLDPVMLVQGKEVQGDFKITVTRGKFQYLFSSAENKAAFEKDPARFEIQLDGACARMGSPVTGNPDLYTVYKGRVYIFGSEGCKKKFEAAPENYLEAEARPKAALTPEAISKGHSLLEKAVSAMGGAARIDGLTAYQEKSTAQQTRRTGDVEVKTKLTILFPDRIRADQSMPDWNNPSAMRQMSIVIVPGQVFGIMSSNGAGDARPLPESVRIDREREIKQRLISILRARKGSSPAAIGSGKVGDTAVEQVALEIDGVRHVLSIDPATGRVLSLSSWRRGPEGNFGQFVQAFSDFRAVDGLTLPFKITAAFDGQPWKEQSPTIDEITVNGKIDQALFEAPKLNKPH